MNETELECLYDMCRSFVSREKNVQWNDILIAMLQIYDDRDQMTVARAIEFALKPGDHSNV